MKEFYEEMDRVPQAWRGTPSRQHLHEDTWYICEWRMGLGARLSSKFVETHVAVGVDNKAIPQTVAHGYK